MGNYSFHQDLKVAKVTEENVGEVLAKFYNGEIVDTNNTSAYDVKININGKEFTFEIKEDFYCEKSGNVAVEFECRGKPSGISVSKADVYVYKIHAKPDGEIVIVEISTEKLKEMIKNKKYFRIVNGGDKGSNTMNYLFKYDTFVEEGKIISKFHSNP